MDVLVERISFELMFKMAATAKIFFSLIAFVALCLTFFVYADKDDKERQNSKYRESLAILNAYSKKQMLKFSHSDRYIVGCRGVCAARGSRGCIPGGPLGW